MSTSDPEIQAVNNANNVDVTPQNVSVAPIPEGGNKSTIGKLYTVSIKKRKCNVCECCQ